MAFLDALGADGEQTLRRLATPRRFAKGTALFHQDQLPDRVLVVATGRVKLVRLTGDGRELMLGVRGPGDVLGEQAAIDAEPRSAGAVALEPVEALALGVPDFLSFVERTPAASMFLLRELSARLRDADRKRIELSVTDGLGRVCARLVELCDRYGEAGETGVRIDLPLTQEELAGWTGSSREAVSRALQQLRELGWIETARRRITVLDLDALRRRA